MPKESAGVLLYRRSRGPLEVLLVHFGGPFWRHRDAGAWSMPKGLIEPGETPEATARREFEEEVGIPATGPLDHLCRIRQAGGKWVEAFALEGDFDPSAFVPHFEVDRVQWFPLDEARAKILKSQEPILDVLVERLGGISP